MVRLKYERLKRGWSLQTLGHKARVQGAAISQMERGILLPYAGQRARLARVLGLEPDTLLEEVDGGEVAVPARVAGAGNR